MAVWPGIVVVHIGDYSLRKETKAKNPVLGEGHMFGLDMCKLRYQMDLGSA